MDKKTEQTAEKNSDWTHVSLQRIALDMANSVVAGTGNRVETGAVQFLYSPAGDTADRPGYFLRGENAATLASAITTLLPELQQFAAPEGRIETKDDERKFFLYIARKMLEHVREDILNDVVQKPVKP